MQFIDIFGKTLSWVLRCTCYCIPSGGAQWLVCPPVGSGGDNEHCLFQGMIDKLEYDPMRETDGERMETLWCQEYVKRLKRLGDWTCFLLLP